MYKVKKIGLQLYSVKEKCAEDFFGTLDAVAKAGYDGVEFAGYHGKSSKELKQRLESNQLQAAGSHVGIQELENNLEKVIDYSLEIESPFIVCPGLPDEYRNSADAYKRTAEQFTRIGETCAASGIAFGYHNHDIELQTFDGEYGLDLLFAHSDPNKVFMELDTYWLEATGLKSVDWINRYKQRIKALHIKDMNNLEEKINVEVGSGVMNFKEIISAAASHQVQWYIVEQEEYSMDEIKSIGISASYLKSIL
ncbi:sugar phosphate isomerase/epimerase family protein [Alkalicoccobacillus porphyridii]|uniref:Sugar phosphate isomerase/epimerase n=1 Tax=Alkalicoccobacillus porphyridii TaxID=2597270 RepID=A0A553ZWA5_9BACI|nr:sugar phosphate isomerase/epimerase [Alkalicoccobacillus porphyridii]TSB45760.1 sugar phosphate isomerase/epimerase [Alkalicoccobacillus porphyridii]